MNENTPEDHGLKQLLHGCEHVYSDEELKQRLADSARRRSPLRVKLGLDPTAPDLHLGHVVVLRKLREFQDLGHRAVCIIGDFTARIGDPSGRSKTRPVLTTDDIKRNADTYFKQAGRVLDMSAERLEVRYNSEWLGEMDFGDVLRLAGRMTVQQMLKRDDFRRRHETETPISIHELLYPLVQGWDSVCVNADVELGGTDQLYNNLVGRELQSQESRPPQVVMTLPLLRGLDGEKKMSKSYDNYIAVEDEATQFFGKTMSIPDALMPEWYALLTDVPESQWQSAVATDPMAAKRRLAVEIGARFHSRENMEQAAEWWRAHFGKQKQVEALPLRIAPEHVENNAAPAWRLAWLAHDREISKSEAKRMVQGGAFAFEGKKITDPNAPCPVSPGSTFRAGRHRKGERVKQPLVVEIVE